MLKNVFIKRYSFICVHTVCCVVNSLKVVHWCIQSNLFPYSSFQILFGGFLVLFNLSFRKCIVNFSTAYHTQFHILIVTDTKFILPWTHSNYVNALLLFFILTLHYFKLRINNALNVLANNLSTRRLFFFFTKKLLVIMLAMTEPNPLYRNYQFVM